MLKASGNTIQTVQQLTQGEKSLENITLGESIKNVSKQIWYTDLF